MKCKNEVASLLQKPTAGKQEAGDLVPPPESWWIMSFMLKKCEDAQRRKDRHVSEHLRDSPPSELRKIRWLYGVLLRKKKYLQSESRGSRFELNGTRPALLLLAYSCYC